MPRENRKRGKKIKKQTDDDLSKSRPPQEPQALEPIGEPSWIRFAPRHDPEGNEFNPEAPFGYVDADVKAYFRTVDVQIRDWQVQEDQELDHDKGPNEERRLFFIAALTEMGGKEKQLMTDPDCSVILERMIYSMDDFVRRVFIDSLTSSFEVLVRHRFASHVCQTLFSVASETISRESRGILPNVPETADKGELRTLTQLVLDVAEELVSSFSSLIMDPFASHVVRALLTLLSPSVSSLGPTAQGTIRSKKSATWKAKQGPMRSVFTDEKGKGKEVVSQSRPTEFSDLARRLVDILRTELGENEVRALAANKVASPGLQMLLEVEADCGMTDNPDSLMDRVMVGIISTCVNDPGLVIEPSDYLNTLLRDPTSSHLLETIVTRSPDQAFVVLWDIYFKGTLPRLANHPVANFVVAKALERVSPEQLSEACEELKGTWNKLISTSKTGVLRAAIDRSAILQSSEHLICEAVYSAFEMRTVEDRVNLVPCVLHLLSLQEYKASSKSQVVPASLTAPHKRHGRSEPEAENNLGGSKIQGSILLQSLLRLPAPHNDIVITNIMALPMERRIEMAHDASGSRVYDVLLESPTVPSKAKRELIMEFIGHYHVLVDDRLGSRVGDRCWAFADTYLKEKIARSLFFHEQFLAASYYGKFFARNLNLYLLQRRPNEWKTMQANRKRTPDKSSNLLPNPESEHPHVVQKSTKRKRHTHGEDEIDAVFNASLGKRIKKTALGQTASVPSPSEPEMDVKKSGGLDSLQVVLGAIKSAPKDERSNKKRKKHQV
ncbi:hypothetical protein H2248_005913 [Termitomyces sp. 'cryptogamus']|nr:hypothetical protein H2248_005913 [Termitomyces sp. 'cryptogamus']